MRLPASLFVAMCALLVSAVSGGCRLLGPPGEVEVLSPYIRAPEPVESVELYLDDREYHDRPREVIAVMSTEVRARQWPSMAEAESAGYDRLRFFAARAGALAVINVEQWVTLHGEPVEVNLDVPRPAAEEYIIHMRGEAVRFDDPPRPLRVERPRIIERPREVAPRHE